MNLWLSDRNATFLLLILLQVFRITGKYVELNPAFRDYQERTAKVADVLQNLRKEGELCALKGWRDEVRTFSFTCCFM